MVELFIPASQSAVATRLLSLGSYRLRSRGGWLGLWDPAEDGSGIAPHLRITTRVTGSSSSVQRARERVSLDRLTDQRVSTVVRDRRRTTIFLIYSEETLIARCVDNVDVRWSLMFWAGPCARKFGGWAPALPGTGLANDRPPKANDELSIAAMQNFRQNGHGDRRWRWLTPDPI
ncbi:hypothetical protein G7K_6658-t1 [Saitoella complicata NRRL Y-17804]|uniref:Uncharacterized protein n=1 Tax=Saitoella complicata (strain BCRC 22490 / CBS 7301 / JCM 7358 / NBRC 10748 / NRRL Y-17804) TaxID=698492 RepID=A0A0E9NT48_SAICN|nr:hypothetical protein G7K_6658-t1 [Saitoella complicata NRRL Y-17804]